ncbi:MAG: hypothetical protein KDD40_00115 [Bdellovibrionales bacterium]|nr:hypothetical protein [Bdellovibrionales bacterium]
MRTVSRLKYSILLALAFMVLFVLLAPNVHAQNRLNEPHKTRIDMAEDSYLGQSPFQGDWKLAIGAQSFEESTDDEKTASVELNLRPSYRLLDNLKLNADMRIKSESGRVQTRFYQGSEDLLRLSNASIEYYPVSFVLLEGGIINQSYLEQELLFAKSRAFAGVKEAIIWGRPMFKASLIFQQSLPSSTSLNTERTEKEATPSFQAQTLQAEFDAGKLKGIVGGSLYQYQNLPSKVAFESYKNGNIVEGSDVADSSFANEFNGYALNARFDWEVFHQFSLLGTLQLMENTKAPEGSKRGQMAWVGPVIQINKIKTSLSYGQYFAEYDVAPAYYMNLAYGGTNRVGQFGRFEIEFTNLNFKLLAQYVDADTINSRVHQFTRTNYLVRLETLYVSF